MSDHTEEITIASGACNSIRFAPFSQDPQLPEGGVIEVRGGYNLEALDGVAEFLVNNAGHVFKEIRHADDSLCIVLQYGYEWLTTRPYIGDLAPELVVIGEKLDERSGVTVLAYVIFVLCVRLNWSAADVLIEKTPIG